MNWLEGMNSAVSYIEAHLEEEISYDQAARIACCSTYHFQRMFSFISGVPLSEYIRRRRLTLAASELQSGKVKVIDVSLKYGYESPEAFSRAFKRLHGVMPVMARDEGVSLKAFPRITFHITIKGDAEMNYRIEKKGAIEIFGLELKTNVIDGQCYRDIPAFWEKCAKEGKLEALLSAAGKAEGDIIDVGATYAHNPNGGMNYMIACYKRSENIPAEYTLLSIPEQTWAVFSTDWRSEEDDAKLHDVWGRIYSEWFPSVSHEHADCDFDLEVYFGSRETTCGAEIWIPVIMK